MTQELISGVVNRKIGIIVLKGTEDWIFAPTSLLFYLNGLPEAYHGTHTCISTHYDGTSGSATSGSLKIRMGSATNHFDRLYIYENTTTYPDATAFKAFLAAQYAAGTPVIVVYPLAAETTEQAIQQPIDSYPGENNMESISNVQLPRASVIYYK